MGSTYVVLDTHVIINALTTEAEYRPVIERVVTICHRVAFNKRMLNQYVTKAHEIGMDAALVYRMLLTDLPADGKAHEVRQKMNSRDLEGILGFLGPKNDQPFLRVALLSQAKYLISNDRHFHERYGELEKHGVKVVYPDWYAVHGD